MGIFFGFRGGNQDKTQDKGLNPLGGFKAQGPDFSQLYARVRQGDATAARELNDIYVEGKGVAADDEQAYFWARVAGDLGDSYGYYLTGLYHKEGVGVPVDLDKAYAFLDAAASKGNAFAFTEKCRITENRIGYFKDEERLPLEELKRRATTAPNAGEYFKNSMLMAARDEDVEGKNWAGLCLRDGIGVTPDQLAAAYWFREAGNKDNMYGCYNLAGMYESGRGVRLDYDEAIKWYGYAKELGHQTAQLHIDRLQKIKAKSRDELLKMALDNRNWDFNIAVMHNFYQYLADAGVSTACLWVANDFRGADGTKRDYYEARYYYAKTIVFRGPGMIANPEGFGYRMISEMYAMGQGTDVDMARANKYYEKAQETNSFAQKFPSVTAYIENERNRSRNALEEVKYCLEGYTRNPDVPRAISILEQEAQRGSYQANVKLAAIYAYGAYVDTDWRKMLEYINRARNCADVDQKRWDMARQGCLLGYHNLMFGIGYDMFYDVVLNTASIEAFRSNQNDLAYAYLALARQFGMNVDWIEQQYAPRQSQDVTPVAQQTQVEATVQVEEPASKETIEIVYEYKPEYVSEEQMEEIRALVRDGNALDLYNLGISYAAGFEGKEECGRLAALCYKLAIDRNCVDALYGYAALLESGIGIARDIHLMKRICDRLEGIDLEENAEGYQGLVEATREYLEEEPDESEEDLQRRYNMYYSVARELDSEHFPEEEWLIYEYYKMAEYKRCKNGRLPMQMEFPYAEEALDWDAILAKPWEKYANYGYLTEDTREIPMARLSDESNGAPEEMPENLDGYFEGMIGMESVKEQLDKIYQTVKMQIMRDEILRARGEEPLANEKGYNFILLGNPGTGKTTIARIIAKILYDIKVRTSDAFVEIERSSVVSDHVGGTEKRMREILEKVDGGTLFIDEAYALYKEDSDVDFGQEAIDVLMKDMEDHRNSYSVIMAGYREPMLNMIRHANSGFSSRFSYTIELPDYSDEALIEIAHMHMAKQKFEAEDGVDVAIKKCIAHDKLDDTFGNARYIRELVHRAIENQSQRLSEQGSFEPDELFKLRPEDFWQGSMEEEGVETYLAQLHALTGLKSVKEEVESLINTITVQKEMEKRGIAIGGDLGTLHMAFKGNPGTGKTTVARLIGRLYACLGVLKRGDVFVECTRADLVGKYQGHTAENVKKVVESALGGILFVDEAYSLVQGEGDSFGKEAVDTLVAEIENNRQNLVIIFAGYSRDIDEFFKNNQGLRSRVPKDLFFEDYNLEELYDIALGMLAGRKLVPTEEAKQELRARIFRESIKEDFGNARGIRNIIDSIWRKQNVRIANLLKGGANEVTDEMLLRVEVTDIQ